jgi:hypothetical protein
MVTASLLMRMRSDKRVLLPDVIMTEVVRPVDPDITESDIVSWV